MCRAFVQPRHEIVVGPDLLIALDRAAEPARFEPGVLEVSRSDQARVTSDSVGAHITPPGTMKLECGHCPPNSA